MCVQNISISDDKDFLNFLNDCKEDKLYPPLRFYENENFMSIDGADRKKASISKVGFKVVIDGIAYTSQQEARTKLLTHVNAINRGSDSGIVNTTYVSDISHLPEVVNGDINALDLNTYIATTKIDLKGARIVAGNRSVFIGFSSENCGYFSTGLIAGKALFKASSTTTLRFIEFKGDGTQTALDIDCLGNTGGEAAFDWLNVNFESFADFGTIKNFDNFIFKVGVFRDGLNLKFDGTFDSTVIEDSLLQSSSATGDLIVFPSTAVCNRRIRIESSPLILLGSANGINASVSMTIPNEAYILEKINVTNLGSGTPLVGIDSFSHKALFTNCVGIDNTAAGGSMFGKGNALTTSIPATNEWVKVAIATTKTPDTQKFTHTNNQLTCVAMIKRKYLVLGNLSFSTTNNKICKFGIYHSKSIEVDKIEPMSIVTQEADGLGKGQSVPFHATIFMQGDDIAPDYVEVWALMTNGTNDIVVEDLTLSVVDSK